MFSRFFHRYWSGFSFNPIHLQLHLNLEFYKQVTIFWANCVREQVGTLPFKPDCYSALPYLYLKLCSRLWELKWMEVHTSDETSRSIITSVPLRTLTEKDAFCRLWVSQVRHGIWRFHSTSPKPNPQAGYNLLLSWFPMTAMAYPFCWAWISWALTFNAPMSLLRIFKLLYPCQLVAEKKLNLDCGRVLCCLT